MRRSEKSAEKPIELKPVGFVKNQAHETNWGNNLADSTWQEKAARMKEQGQAISELVINPELDGILDGIEEFSHLMVLYWSHLIPENRRNVTRVHPMGSKDFPLVGTFATHSPARPNSILVTVVKLLERNGNVLKVTGLDAMDGSPILDIKTYMPDMWKQKDIRMPDWVKKMRQTFKECRK